MIEDKNIARYAKERGRELQADLPVVTWDLTPPEGIAHTEHRLSFVDTISRMSSEVFQRIRTSSKEVIIAGHEAYCIIASLPGFRPEHSVLSGKWRVVPSFNTQGQYDFQLVCYPNFPESYYVATFTVFGRIKPEKYWNHDFQE